MKKIVFLMLILCPVILFAQVDEEVEEEQEVFEVFTVSEPAKFIGGEDELYAYFGKNIEYPELALADSISGTVILMFVIGTEGQIEDIKTMNKKIGYGLEEEAIRVLKSTSGLWLPAKQREEAVKMRYRLPVRFMIY